MRTFAIDLGELQPGTLSFGDLIDVAEASGVDPEEMQGLISTRSKRRGADKLKLLCAFAWIVGRRTEPALTYADVLAGQVSVTGSPDSNGPGATPGAPA